MIQDQLEAMLQQAKDRLYRYDNTEPGCRESIPRQRLVGQIDGLRVAVDAARTT